MTYATSGEPGDDVRSVIHKDMLLWELSASQWVIELQRAHDEAGIPFPRWDEPPTRTA